MWYIKDTVDVGLIFEKDFAGKQECTGYMDSDYAGDFDKRQSTIGYVFTLSQAPVSWHRATKVTSERSDVVNGKVLEVATWKPPH